MSVNFQRYDVVRPELANLSKTPTLYSDVCSHCTRYEEMREAGSKCTTTHECTHGVNAEIRNKSGSPIGYYQGQPTFVQEIAQSPQAAHVNAFYVGGNRCVVIPEPGIRKSNAASYVPSSLRGARFSQYVTGQTAWENSPLYIFDEWTAYVNGAWAAYGLIKAGEFDETGRIIDGHIEFISYALGICMAADHAGELRDDLKSFTRWQLRHAFNVYFLGRGLFPTFPAQDKLYETLRSGPDAESLRSFLTSKLNYAIPTTVEDEDGGTLSEASFKVVGV
jgi:hypothetical protein